jgi:hypothetical protein
MRAERQPDGDTAFMRCCDLCGGEFRYGQHRYAGRPVPEWDILICEPCENMNHDGLVPQQHPELMQRLAENGLKLERLSGGFIRIPPRGH